jgi:hypothetical protein
MYVNQAALLLLGLAATNQVLAWGYLNDGGGGGYRHWVLGDYQSSYFYPQAGPDIAMNITAGTK